MDGIAGDVSREHRFAIKQAGFNLLFLMLGGIVLAGLYAVYKMMNMFLLPVTWAFLLGTVLFPVKYRLDLKFKGWLDHLDNTDTPLIIGIMKLPYDHFTSLSEWMFGFFCSRNGVYFGIVAVVLKLLNYKNTLSGIFYLIGRKYEYIDSALQFLNYSSWILPLILLYAVSYGTWLYVQNPDSIHKKFARCLSLPIWIYGLAYISDYGGPFRALIFTTTSVLLGLISAGVVEANDDEIENRDEVVDNNEFLPDENPPEMNEEGNIHDAGANVTDQLPALDDVVVPISSDRHIQVIMGLVITVWIIKYEFLLVLFLLPLQYAMLKRLNQRIGITNGLQTYVLNFWRYVSPHVTMMFTVIVAGSLRKFLKILFTSDRFMISTLKSKSDVLATVFVMSLLAFGSVFCIFFVIFQIHNETVHLIRLGSDVISNNPEWLKYAVNYTDKQLKDHNIDDYVEQAYQQGRIWLASNVRALANPKDNQRADELEQQAMLLIDQFYKLWEERNLQATNASAQALSNSETLMDHISHITNLQIFQNELTAIVKDNIDTVLSIVQSLWAVVIVNISVLSSILFAIFGFVLSFGFDMMNLFIETVVFLTIVFYLLSYSNDRWLPLQWMEILASSIGTSQVGNRRADIISAIENAISGVFVLSAKMALFYGLYTYFLHSLFNLNVVFIPSLLATLFAAIPILPAYSVLIFGAIELYFIRQETVAAIVFSVLSVAPIGFADAAFYREVKNSHPYVTGLAIIGGMYWLGLEGAIFGPIILCSMIALVNVYAQIFGN